MSAHLLPFGVKWSIVLTHSEEDEALTPIAHVNLEADSAVRSRSEDLDTDFPRGVKLSPSELDAPEDDSAFRDL